MYQNKQISIIVAVAQNNAIGYKNQLLCHLPNDLKYFKTVTASKTVIMGKNTWYSLPNKPLPNRRNIVLTDVVGEQFEGAEAVYSIEEILNLCDSNEECFVIGGGSVYRQFLPFAEKLYITHIDNQFEADTFFPTIEPEVWKVISKTEQLKDEKNPYNHSFVVYERIEK